MSPPTVPAPWLMVVNMAYAMSFAPDTGHPIVWKNELAHHPRADPDSRRDRYELLPVQSTRASRARVLPRGPGSLLPRRLAAEKAMLDFGGRRGWERTGKYFRSLDATVGIGRFLSADSASPMDDTHFFSAFADECDAVARLAGRDPRDARSVSCRAARHGNRRVRCRRSSAYEAPLPAMPVYLAWSNEPGATARFATRLSDQIGEGPSGMDRRGVRSLGQSRCAWTHSGSVRSTCRSRFRNRLERKTRRDVAHGVTVPRASNKATATRGRLASFRR